MQFVLDNSVTMRWLFSDGSPSDQTYAEQILASISDGDVWAPSIWYLEVSNVIARAEEKYGLTHADSSKFVHALEQMHIQIDLEIGVYAISNTLELARRYKLSAYDAAYLALALKKELPLATLDEGLRKAALKAGVKIFNGNKAKFE